MALITVHSRIGGEPTVPAGWYVTCPDAHVGPYPTEQAADTALTTVGRDCTWSHQATDQPAT